MEMKVYDLSKYADILVTAGDKEFIHESVYYRIENDGSLGVFGCHNIGVAYDHHKGIAGSMRDDVAEKVYAAGKWDSVEYIRGVL